MEGLFCHLMKDSNKQKTSHFVTGGQIAFADGRLFNLCQRSICELNFVAKSQERTSGQLFTPRSGKKIFRLRGKMETDGADG